MKERGNQAYSRLTKKKLPPYNFLPGKNPHPEKEGGYHFGKKLEVISLDEYLYSENEDFLYAFDLFNLGYYWESHVWWEEFWHQVGRNGDKGDLLKGLIKLAAAGVKLCLKEEEVANIHIERAKELFKGLAGPEFGLDPRMLLETTSNYQLGNHDRIFFKNIIPNRKILE